ncbi:succinylglutamate desuccinylase/aspartoacylase family protein [Oceanibacterium hippocampi]|uniref:Aspartoacylase n=1 Tax=Oceanibacterium hippocampi TaxID=745714 RepID=A0A1Y5TRF6_9PROT|nr:succinylglutamate desuccinylase/aspartoacylase family protein [Oceanibacterium hippocampi]SLN70385.1 aspartoacylase [Oceanibacterium hippocampi]
MREPFTIGGATIAAGTRETIDLPLTMLSTHTPMTLPVHVVHGRREGPVLFVSAALHGDEINGVEIIRRLLKAPQMAHLKGTLIAAPIINVYGFISHIRYLPDRRDLNRSFPGAAGGSLAGQLANLFMTEIVSPASLGIDLHTGAIHRTNLPQIRLSPEDQDLKQLAKAFGAPVILRSPFREGSLRAAAMEKKVPVLVYEAGEALRFDEHSIRVGVTGVLRVMSKIGMIARLRRHAAPKPVVAKSSYWVRAPASGIVRTFVRMGAVVHDGEQLGIVSDPFGEQETTIIARNEGILVGRSNLPVVNQGDALYHIARLEPNVAREDAEELLEDHFNSFDPDRVSAT